MVPPLITLEEHFLSQAVLQGAESQKYDEQFKHVPALGEQLRDLGPVRLRHMNESKISFQIISHGPGCPAPEECVQANDQLAEAVATNKTRFAGFAVCPMGDPLLAAAELERSVVRHGFVGALVDNHINGRFYDGDEYLQFWAKAQELDVPIYLHPVWPPEHLKPSYTGNFTQGATASLGSSAFGWHSETAIHILRLHASGLFDKLPRLKVIVGHMGEMLPFMLERVCALSVRWGKRDRDFRTVYDENLWITTSGVWGLAPLACILQNTKVERILFSVDYPFQTNANGLKWIEDLEKSGMVTSEQLDMIAYRNSEKLLRVKAPTTL